METDLSLLHPFVYCRKSHEREDRQVLSLPAQIEEAEKLIKSYNITGVSFFEEAKSAKVSGRRPIFSSMIKDIKRGRANAIICWKLDRLARNMKEGGEIIDMLQHGIIKAIITPGKVYFPTENALIMSLEFASANQYSRDLSQNVKRGQEKKARLGYPHGVAAIGFLNDKTEEKGNRKWVVDPIRFPLVKQMFEMYLSGNYSGSRIHQWMVNEAKLTTPQHKHSGNKLISRSRLYELLSDPIYAGFFYLQGEQYRLAPHLPRAITPDEHYQIRAMLGKYSGTKRRHHESVYSGFIISDNNEYMNADVKMQVICDCKYKFSYANKEKCPKCGIAIRDMNKPTFLRYVYYQNLSKKKRKESVISIREDRVTHYFVNYVEEHFVLSDKFIEWASQHFDQHEDEDVKLYHSSIKAKRERLHTLQLKKGRYRELVSTGLFTSEEYQNDIKEIDKEIALISFDKPLQKWKAEAIELLTIGQTIVGNYEKLPVKNKRALLCRIGSNLIWNEKYLDITNRKEIKILIDGLKEAKAKNPLFEPKTTLADKDKTGVFISVSSLLLRTLDDLRQCIKGIDENLN